MKKLFCFILSMILLLSFTGCGNEATENSGKTSSVTVTSLSSQVTSSNSNNNPLTNTNTYTNLDVVAKNLGFYYTYVAKSDDEHSIVEKVIDNKASYAFADDMGNILGDGFIYSELIYSFNSGLAPVTYNDGSIAYVNKNFEKVITPNDIDTGDIKYDDMAFYYFQDNLAVISIRIENDWIDAVIDTSGKIAIPFDTKNKYNYSYNGNGTFTRTGNNGDCVVDKKRKVLFKYNNCNAATNENGFIIYQTENSTGDLLMGLMDQKYKKITEAIYHYDPQLSINSDMIYVTDAKSNKGMFINSKGQEVLEIDDVTSAKVYDSVILCTKKDDNSYIYSRDGKQLSTKGFYLLEYASEEYIITYDKSGMCTIIDTNGNTVFELGNVTAKYSNQGYFYLWDNINNYTTIIKV